jgi:hypothetical protein
MTNCCYNCTIINPKHFIMRKLIFAFLMLPCLTMAQSLIGGNNIIKANLSSLAFGNYHVTYERSIAKKLSLSVSYRFMPKTSVPFASSLQDLINNPDVKITSMQLGNNAITPELRIYLGTGKMKGFYIAPYARFANFDVRVPLAYDNPSIPGAKKEITFDGSIKSTSAGLMIGMQKQIAKKLVLDIWFIGGHYGSSNGTINAINVGTPLNASEQSALQSELDNLKNNGGPFKFEGKVNAAGTGAEITSTGPWAGVRGAMISLGFRF